jgi:hypothetical protein
MPLKNIFDIRQNAKAQRTRRNTRRGHRILERGHIKAMPWVSYNEVLVFHMCQVKIHITPVIHETRLKNLRELESARECKKDRTGL